MTRIDGKHGRHAAGVGFDMLPMLYHRPPEQARRSRKVFLRVLRAFEISILVEVEDGRFQHGMSFRISVTRLQKTSWHLAKYCVPVCLFENVGTESPLATAQSCFSMKIERGRRCLESSAEDWVSLQDGTRDG